MRKVLNTSKGPPGGKWIYVCPEDGEHITAQSFIVIKQRALNYRKINNYPVGSNWDDDFEQNLCEHMHLSVCTDWSPPTLGQKLENLKQSLLNYARSGFTVTDSDKVKARLDICMDCNYYSGQRGTLKIMCKKCGCTGLKLFMASSVCPDKKW
jgi:hypothetical protein